MLRDVTAEFPNPGARALLTEGVKALPVRIHQIVEGRAKGPNREAIVTLLDRDGVASGTRRVTLGELQDANPLSPEEEAELTAIEAKYAGKHLSERSPYYRRYMALWHRREHAMRAAELERLKGREPRPWPPLRRRPRG